MAVYVKFIMPSSKGVIGAISHVADRLTGALPLAPTRKVLPGELVVVHNDESAPVAVAWGSTPDASATTATASTTAGLSIPTGLDSPPLEIPPGSLISVKAL